MKKWNRLVVSLLATLLLATVLSLGAFFHPPTAHAGSRGQQLQFNCAGISLMYVAGYNQNGDWVEWPAPGQWGLAPNGNLTANYWWVGTVYIEVVYGDWTQGPTSTATYQRDVPLQFGSDIFTADCYTN
jgi:hypothetical protein